MEKDPETVPYKLVGPGSIQKVHASTNIPQELPVGGGGSGGGSGSGGKGDGSGSTMSGSAGGSACRSTAEAKAQREISQDDSTAELQHLRKHWPQEGEGGEYDSDEYGSGSSYDLPPGLGVRLDAQGHPIRSSDEDEEDSD